MYSLWFAFAYRCGSLFGLRETVHHGRRSQRDGAPGRHARDRLSDNGHFVSACCRVCVGDRRFSRAWGNMYRLGRLDRLTIDRSNHAPVDPYRPPVLGCGDGNGRPPRTLIDGHVTSFVDLGKLAAEGARDFLFVNVLDAESERRPRFSPRGFISTLVHQLLRAQVDNSLAPLRRESEELGLRAFELGPSKPLTLGVFRFDRKECREAFELGNRDADAFLDGPKRIL